MPPETRPKIHYLVKGIHAGVIRGYLETWGAALAPRFDVIPYHRLFSRTRLEPGIYIFTDIERLTTAQKRLVSALLDRMAKAGPGFRFYNDPAKVLSRFELLRRLQNAGQNRFTIYRLDEIPREIERPVFLRHGSDHSGSFTEPTTNREELLDSIGSLTMADVDPREQMAVEFLDTADSDGIYQKFSAFRVGSRIIPRHEIFSQRWDLRYPDLLEPFMLAEEMAYLESNPHQAALRAVFNEAAVEYGRVDYALWEDTIQIWEINTNPIVMLHPTEYAEEHLPAQEWFAPRIAEAYLDLLDGLPRGEPFDVDFDRSLIELLVNEPHPGGDTAS